MYIEHKWDSPRGFGELGRRATYFWKQGELPNSYGVLGSWEASTFWGAQEKCQNINIFWELRRLYGYFQEAKILHGRGS